MTKHEKLMFEALCSAEGALQDYIDYLKRQGAQMNYGHAVLAQVRAAIAFTKLKKEMNP